MGDSIMKPLLSIFSLTIALALIASPQYSQARAKVPENKIKKLDKKEDHLEEAIEAEEKEIAELKAKKDNECKDPSQPCLWDEVIEASQDQLDDLKKKASKVSAKKEEVCQRAMERMEERQQRWSGLVNDLQPLKDKIEQKKEVLKALIASKKDTDKNYKDDFQKAIKANREEIEQLRKELAKKYSEKAGASLARAPSFNKARLRLAHVEHKQARVKAICNEENNRAPASEPPKPEENQNPPADPAPKSMGTEGGNL